MTVRQIFMIFAFVSLLLITVMFALGCVQSRTCHTDNCPTGVATQNPARYKALVVEDKAVRVANFHRETVKNLAELLGLAGLDCPSQLQPRHINHRVKGTIIRNYSQMYPRIGPSCLLSADGIPEDWREDWELASASHW